METITQKRWDLLIIPCWGDSYPARLVVQAAKELTLQSKIRVLQKKEIDHPGTIKEALINSDRCIIVDGCYKRCMIKKLKEYQGKTEFELNLTDIGIDNRQQVDLDPEDLELTKNAILAASTRISMKHPIFPGCCC